MRISEIDKRIISELANKYNASEKVVEEAYIKAEKNRARTIEILGESKFSIMDKMNTNRRNK